MRILQGRPERADRQDEEAGRGKLRSRRDRPEFPRALLAVALACVPIAPALADDVLHPTIGWPVGAVADIQLAREVVRAAGDDDARWETTESWSVAVHADPAGGVRVVPGPRTILTDTWTGTAPRSPGMILVQVLADDNGTWILSEDGRLVDVVPFAAQLRLGPLAQIALRDEPQGARTWRSAGSHPSLLGAAKQRWGALIELWRDADGWTLGEVRQHDVPQPTPGLTGTYTSTAERTFVARVPCQEGGPPRCVEMAMESRFDKKSVEAYHELVKGGEAKGPLAVNEEIVAVVADPEGMLPYHATLRRRTTTLYPEPSGAGFKIARANQEQSRIMVFDWTLPAGPQLPE
ncbi:MAG: hypothetical protein ACI8PZ_000060 [Myxococcota bacterium]|jgi:hypothetical protein